MRPTITTIAEQAGVSTATVDRVLNNRPGVRPATVQLVKQTAAALNYYAGDDVMPITINKPFKALFLLPSGMNRYLNMLSDHANTAHERLDRYNIHCRSKHVDGFNPEELAETLIKEGKNYDGIAFMALEHPLVREATNQLAEQGVHTITLISDLSSSARKAYIGLDNRAAGRTAGLLMGRLIAKRKGKVALIAGSRYYRGHEEREMGFQHILEEKFPALEIIGLREGHDDAQSNYKQTIELLNRHHDLIGIYSIGGAPEGIAHAIKESNRQNDIILIGHGLTPDTRFLLIDGTLDVLLNQNLHQTIVNTVRIFANIRDGRSITAGIEPIHINIILSENLP